MELNTEDEVATKEVTSANPHVFSRQAVGFVFWVGLLSFLTGGITVAVMNLTLGGVTFADAWKSGIYKNSNKKSFLNISPMSWGIVMVLLFIVAYPTYLINRNKLRTLQVSNGYFVAVVIVGAVNLALTILSILVQRGIIVA